MLIIRIEIFFRICYNVQVRTGRNNMDKDLERLVLSEEQIAKKVRCAAAWIDERFEGAVTPPVAVCVLKGAVFFFCDLVRAMQTPAQLDFIKISSYGDATESSGKPEAEGKLPSSVRGRDVILVEDIVDSGYTLAALKESISKLGAKSVTAVTLFDKPSRRKTPVKADYSCFEIGDEFIVGYGLDYAQKYRNLPYVGVLKRALYEGK